MAKASGQSQIKSGIQLYLTLALSILFGGVIFYVISVSKISTLLEEMELKTYDLRAAFKLGDTADQPSRDVIIVKFDDPTLSVFEDEYGVWPWPRSIHADMIDYLNEAGAKAIAFDIMFVSQKKGMEADDQVFIDSFRKHKNVYLSMNFDNMREINEKIGKGLTPEDISLLKPLSLKLDSQLSSENNAFSLGADGFYKNDAMTFNNVRLIMPQLMAAEERIAFVNHGRDKDGVSRKNPLFFRFTYKTPLRSTATPYVYDANKNTWFDQNHQPVNEEGTMLNARGKPLFQEHFDYYPYLGLRLLLDLKYPDQKPELTLTKDGYLKFDNHTIPLSEDGGMLIKWYNVNVNDQDMQHALKQLETILPTLKMNTPEDVAKRQNIEEMVRLYRDNLNHEFSPLPYSEVPAWRILKAIRDEKKGIHSRENNEFKKYFKNKIIFVGTTAVSTFDIKTTPIKKVTPGVILQASIFDNLYQNSSYMKRLSPLNNIIITGLLVIMSAILTIKMRSAVVGMITTIMLAALYCVFALVVFQTQHLWINVIVPVIALVVTTAMTFMVKYISRNQDFQETYKLATTDSMTGLYNHRYFQEHMLESLENARKTGGKFSLVLIDIDFFKKFNDTYGHQAGDEVLRHVARKLKNSVRSNDIVARYGGEEMAVILDKTDEKESMEVAKKLVKLVAEEAYPIAEGVAKHVTISVGVSTYPLHGSTTAELIEFSDQGLYRAKENGRNQVGAQYNHEMPGHGDAQASA